MVPFHTCDQFSLKICSLYIKEFLLPALYARLVRSSMGMLLLNAFFLGSSGGRGPQRVYCLLLYLDMNRTPFCTLKLFRKVRYFHLKDVHYSYVNVVSASRGLFYFKTTLKNDNKQTTSIEDEIYVNSGNNILYSKIHPV